MCNVKIYDNICAAAKVAGISINWIEKTAELSVGSVCKWNTVSPTVRSLKKVADVLKVPVEQLLEETPVNKEKENR